MPVKTKGMRDILEPIQLQINKLRALTSNDNSMVHDAFPSKSVLFEQLYSLGDSFDALSKENISDFQELKSRITDVIEKFCSLEYNAEMISNVNNETLDNIVSTVYQKFLSALKTLEALECLPLKQSLSECWEYIREMGAASEIEHFRNIKELGSSMLELLGPLQKYRKSLTSELLSERLMLYSCQMCTAFKLLVQIVEEQHKLNAPIYNCKKYICDRLCLCIKMIVDILDSSKPTEEEEIYEKENHFVYRMDLALDIVADMSNKNPAEQKNESHELWLRIEDVFSHAMAIAQVCCPQNFKAITGACQSIMTEYENLNEQLNSQPPDPALNNLFMNALNDALYRLERKINISVLGLVLEVFSDPFSALRKLVMICGNSLNAQRRSESDLTNAIEGFDQVLDKATQIALFAMASCKDTNRINQIRSCLAGLESLETELVSSVTAFYLRPDSKEMRANVKLLTTQWQLEMNRLHDAVHLIMDSAAYCEIVLDDIQERVLVMSNSLDNREPVTQCQVQGIVQRALSLSRQVSAVINDIGTDMIERQTIMMLRELKAAIYEADVAAKTLLAENPTEPQQLRVIKRCELILNVIKRMQPALAVIMNNSTTLSLNRSNDRKGQEEYSSHAASVKVSSSIYQSPIDNKPLTYIRTPYTVRHCKSPLSIQAPNSIPRSETDLSSLIPYIQKGREMRTELTIMYKTPRRNNSLQHSLDPGKMQKMKARKLSNIRQHLFSRDSITSVNDTYISNESIDLTDILEKFESSCTTFSSVPAASPRNRSEHDTRRIVAKTLANIPESLIRSLESQRSQSTIMPYGKSDEPCAVSDGTKK